MANTYTKIYLHLVFAVKGRESLLPPLEQQRIHSYMGGVLKEMNQFPRAIGGIEDHVHILMEHHPHVSISKIVQILKTASTKYINIAGIIPFKFEWQRGYACFSYASSQIQAVVNYIANQHLHHKKMTLTDEIKMIYDKFGVEYDEKYIFEEIK